MPTFRCAAGHRHALNFGDEQVSLPCPDCCIDVYRFRDALLDVDDIEPAADAPRRPPRLPALAAANRKIMLALGAGIVLLAATAGLIAHTHRAPWIPSANPALPATAPYARSNSPRRLAFITDFSVIASDAGAVKLRFQLTNLGDTASGYPSLAVHWPGADGADQLVRNDAYAHAPLPFTTTTVMLELSRPPGATGIDVTTMY